MNRKKFHHAEMDDLLKRVLKDDLPAESEEKMKRQFALFREAIKHPDSKQRQVSANVRMLWRRLFRAQWWPWASWIFKKEILALFSVAMVVFGSLMHISGQHSVLAESVSRLSTWVSVSDEVRRARSMECTMQVVAQDGQSLAYAVQWLAPDMTRVDVRKAAEIHRTLWISDKGITVADHVKNTLIKVGSIEQIKDALFQPVMAFLSPNELAELMSGKWQLKQYEQPRGLEWGIFMYVNDGGRTLLNMTVNLKSNLPVSIQKFVPGFIKSGGTGKPVMQVEFTWNHPVSPQLMIPGIVNRSQSA